jgi:O-methyltransferase
VQLHVGWFHQTLPTFILPQHDRLILHIDVDVYSSAKFVLETLQHEIRIGTIILFDEFYDGKHELKAFDEFLTSTNMVFRFLGSATSLSQCAFERVG